MQFGDGNNSASWFPTDPAIRRALRRATDGARLDTTEAATLLFARGPHLDALTAAAARVRDAGLRSAGLVEDGLPVVTYSPKVFIPLTRLCRDRCHYCTFAAAPAELGRAGESLYLSADQVLAIARAGAEAGCAEALFTLGDRPEHRWPAAAEWLQTRGYASTLEYLRAMAVLVLEETGLLPHLNPGVMSWQELSRLKPVAPSMGMMLETTSRRLFDQPGHVHHGSPDKDPRVRLRVLTDAGRLAIPFTTGVLVGIGETPAELAESLFAIRQVHTRFGHIQEVIVQNFRAKPDTAMRSSPDADPDAFLAAVAVARLVLGPAMRIQVPPNLSDIEQLPRLLAAGADDWGGVSPVTSDHVNPERPWPDRDVLTAVTESAGFVLRPRLTVHPRYILAGEPWLDARLRPHVEALADSGNGLARTDLAVGGRGARGIDWQHEDASWVSSGRVGLHHEIDTGGRLAATRSDAGHVYGDWSSLRADADALTAVRNLRNDQAPHRRDSDVLRALSVAADAPASLTGEQALLLISSTGRTLDEVCAIADDVRRDAVGEPVSYVVTRNINFTNICYVGCRFCAFAQRRTDADAFTLSLDEVAARAAQAWQLGASEVCVQGGIHPDLPGTGYFDLARAIKRAAPGIHLHAFSPMEVMTGMARTGTSAREFLTELKAAGVDSIPGTAAEILDDEVRWLLTKGKLPADDWEQIVVTAHEVGLPSTSTMMYGHVDEPRHWVAHLRRLARIQRRTGGFTEFVPLPFVHRSAPIYLAGVARPGPGREENRAVHAMARLLLHGLIDNVQVSWVKLGEDGAAAMLRSGCNDLGGTLMEETISRMAGADHGSSRTPAQLEAIATGIGRPAWQRTTLYGTVSRARQLVARRVTGYLPLLTEVPVAATP